MKYIVSGLAVLLLAGCAGLTQVDQSLRQFEGRSTTPLGDGNTNFFARDNFEGFVLTINYLHPQANASSQVVLNGCRRALDLAAIRASQQRGRVINRIDNRVINVRNQPSLERPGYTVCSMTAPVRYAG